MGLVEYCGKCKRALGPNETPCVWQDSVVCRECHAALTAGANRPAGRKGLGAIVTVAGLLLALAVAWWVLHATVIHPMRDQLESTQNRAEATQRSLDATRSQLADANRRIKALTEQVEADRRYMRAVSDDLSSLTRTVNYNADVANRNNRLRY